MTPHLIPIYGSSIIAISILVLFASHNRKTGWKRQSGRFARWLNAFYAGAYIDSTSRESVFRETPSRNIPAWTPMTPSEVSGFSQQLMALRASLGAPGNSPVFDSSSAIHEMVRK